MVIPNLLPLTRLGIVLIPRLMTENRVSTDIGTLDLKKEEETQEGTNMKGEFRDMPLNIPRDGMSEGSKGMDPNIRDGIISTVGMSLTTASKRKCS